MGSLLTRHKFSITFHRAKPDMNNFACKIMNNAQRVRKHELTVGRVRKHELEM